MLRNQMSIARATASRRRHGALLLATASALALLLAGPALAQEAEATAAEATDPAAATVDDLFLDPIVIYGARDVQALEDSAASVAVVDSETIESRSIESFRDAFRMMANVIDADWVDAGFVIRGVNSEGLVPGGAPLASLYIDGVQQTGNGARRGARGLWDVEQVEVYRGPQSTLSGRAALAGAIYLKTKDPEFERQFAVQGSLGNLDSRGGAFMANLPIIDEQIALRVSAEYERSETDINYPTYTGYAGYDDLIEDEYYQIRGKLLLTPADLPDTRALISYSFSHDSPTSSDIAGPGLGFEFDEERGDFNLPVFTEPRNNDVHNVAAEVTHQITDALKFTSLSTLSYSDLTRNSINVGTPGETNVLIGGQEQTLATQEFRLNYAEGRWSGVAGLYGALEYDDNGFERPDYFGRHDISRSERDTANIAAFGEATYEFVPTWKVTGGLRADFTTVDSYSFFSRNGAVTTDLATEHDEFVLLPKIGLSKDLDESQTVGATIQRGFRSGGSSVISSTGEAYSYDPETTWNYELFYKARLLEDRLTLGANVFFQDWDDQQVEVQTIPNDFLSDKIVNAASSRSYGFEVSADYKVTEEISTFLAVGYVHSEFLDFSDLSIGDVTGLPFPEAPDWTIAFGARYQHETGFYVGADAKYVSSYLARFGTAPQEYLDERFIVNLQAGYKTDRWELNAYVENAFDESYFVYNDNDIAATLGDGREFGVRLKATF